jgi:tripartite-type tricarboxylate transporter receptor subunit TctC
MAHERSSLVLVASLLMAFSAHAQGPVWPTAKPLTLIVPFTAGGSVDFIARQSPPSWASASTRRW